MARNILLALGYGFMGAGLLKEAMGAARQPSAPVIPQEELSGARFRKRKTLKGLGDIGTPLAGEDDIARKALAAGEAALTRGTIHTVRNIDERVAYIRKFLNEGSLQPEVRAAAVALLSRKCEWRGNVRWCTTPKAYSAEVATIYKALQDARSPMALRYVRDHAKVDQFTSASKLVRVVRGGDCDDGTIKLGALLMSVGYPVKMRVIQSVNGSSWDHIYLLVQIPPAGPNTRWVPLDWSVVNVKRDGSYEFMPPGWEAPGAAETARTGKPHGMVQRVRDFAV